MTGNHPAPTRKPWASASARLRKLIRENSYWTVFLIARSEYGTWAAISAVDMQHFAARRHGRGDS